MLVVYDEIFCFFVPCSALDDKHIIPVDISTDNEICVGAIVRYILQFSLFILVFGRVILKKFNFYLSDC